MNTANGVQEEAIVNSTEYAYSVDEPITERDCAMYMFTVFSNNSYSKSITGVRGYENIPTGILHVYCNTGCEFVHRRIMIVE